MGQLLETHRTGPHVAGVSQRFFFVEPVHDQKLGIVRVRLPDLVSKASYCSHG